MTDDHSFQIDTPPLVSLPPLIKVPGPTDSIAGALAKAQGAMGAAKKDAENDFFESTYATLASVVDAIREPFSQNGIAYVQLIHHRNTGDFPEVGVETRLLHESGQEINSPPLWVPVRNIKKDGTEGPVTAQTVASAVSYGRRYGLQALSGLPTEDDDGAAASGTTGRSGAKKTRSGKASSNGKVTEPQCKMFFALTKKLGLDDEAIARGFEDRGFDPGTKFEDLNKKQGSEVLDSLKKREGAGG